jgi:hypothetical protein
VDDQKILKTLAETPCAAVGGGSKTSFTNENEDPPGATPEAGEPGNRAFWPGIRSRWPVGQRKETEQSVGQRGETG